MLTKGLKTGILVVAILGLGLTALIGYRVIFLTFVRVPTAAMANTIIPGDYVVVRKRAFGEIKRGDLVIFKYPQDVSVRYLFRVIGLPGDVVQVRGKLVFINGMELRERHVIVEPDTHLTGILKEISSEGSGEYAVFHGSAEEYNLSDSPEESPFGIGSAFRVPADHYYVMGDNRDNSSDSRFWGTVPGNFIVGKPTMILWSEPINESETEPRWDRVFKNLR